MIFRCQDLSRVPNDDREMPVSLRMGNSPAGQQPERHDLVQNAMKWTRASTMAQAPDRAKGKLTTVNSGAREVRITCAGRSVDDAVRNQNSPLV